MAVKRQDPDFSQDLDFRIEGLSGWEPFGDGDILILSNLKIPHILILTIHHSGRAWKAGPFDARPQPA